MFYCRRKQSSEFPRCLSSSSPCSRCSHSSTRAAGVGGKRNHTSPPSCSEWSCEGSPRDQTGPGRVGQDLGPPGVHSHRGWALLPMPVGAHTQPGEVTARGKARCHLAVPSSSTLTCVLHSHPHRCFWLADLRSLHVSPIKCSPNVFPFGTSPDLLITSSW